MSYCTDLLYGQGLTLCFPHPPESAAVQSTKGQTGATNATANAGFRPILHPRRYKTNRRL